MNKKPSVLSKICAAVVCCGLMLGICAPGLSAAATGSELTAAIDKTYAYEKGSDSKVLTDTEAKNALSESIDLLMLAAGRDSGNTAMTDDEFNTYLGYINANLRNGNGSYKAIDFCRGAVAAGAAGMDPSMVGKDSNENRVDLLYKGVYSRSITTLEKAGAETMAFALLALDANGVSNAEIRSAGSKVTRSQLKSGLIDFADSLSKQAVPDAGISAMVLAALAPYYSAGEADVVQASEALLVKLAGLQSADGIIKDSTSATADLMVALCSMGIDPAVNDFFSYDLHAGLMKSVQSDGGFADNASGTKSSEAATAAARCALVAYQCFDGGSLFFDFSSVKAHSVKAVAATTTTNNSTSSGTTTTNKNTSSSSNKVVSSSSSNKNTSSSSSNKNTSSSSGSSSSNKSTSSSSSSGTKDTSAGANARTTGSSVTSGEVVEKSKFEEIKGTDQVYLYEGKWGEEEPYTLSFNGKDITNPMDFNTGISNVANHQLEIDAASGQVVEYITFVHDGDFPGKATATITVSLTDGSYNCYHYNEETATFDEIGSVIVANGMVSFDVRTGGEYFVTDGTAQVSTEDLEMAISDTVDGVVPADTFLDIQGKNTDLVLSGETDRGVRYEIIFNGMDITSPLDFNMTITESTNNWEDISALAEGPLVLNFAHSGVLPGTAHVKFYANLDASVSYGLFYFSPGEKSGVYSGAIEVGDGEFSFDINHCSEYFIAEYTGEDILTAPSYLWLIIVIVIGVLLLGGGVVVFILYRRMGKEAFVAKLKGLLPKKKGKKEQEAEVTEEVAEELSEEETTEEATEDGESFEEIETSDGETDGLLEEVSELDSAEEYEEVSEVAAESVEDDADRMLSFARPVDEEPKN